MLSSKQRAILRSEASHLDAIFQVGKGGVGGPMCASIRDALEARELIKVSVLETADGSAREIAEEAEENGEILTEKMRRWSV